MASLKGFPVVWAQSAGRRASTAPRQYRRPNGRGGPWQSRRGCAPRDRVRQPLQPRRTRVVPRGKGVARIQVGEERGRCDQRNLLHRQRGKPVELAVCRVPVRRAKDHPCKRPHHSQIRFRIGHHRPGQDVIIPPRRDPGRQSRRAALRRASQKVALY